jgi:hypothetical protein
MEHLINLFRPKITNHTNNTFNSLDNLLKKEENSSRIFKDFSYLK